MYSEVLEFEKMMHGLGLEHAIYPGQRLSQRLAMSPYQCEVPAPQQQFVYPSYA
jgi:hypothetical protein